MPKRILVVEDNPVIREVMLLNFNRFKLNCYAVTTGEEAIELAEYFDLILMDIELPGISGVEAAKQIRHLERKRGLLEVPIVAVTSRDNRGECLSAGMNDHFFKPLLRGYMSGLLEKWLFRQPKKSRALG